jgi:glyoxylase-like metal-dependent hydrolase (beta-lactamase superfamily II)
MKKAIFAVVVVVLLALGSLLLATGDRVVVEIDRPDLKVVRLMISGANIYLVERSGKRLMIDSGNPGDEQKLEDYMRGADFDPEGIDVLILTHGHLDHLGTAQYFQQKYGIAVLGGQGDALMFSEGVEQPLCTTSALAVAIDIALQDKAYPLFEADVLVDAPYDLAAFGIDGEVTPVPGHTEGTLVVTLDDVAFVGDLIRGELYRQQTPTRHFFMCDLADNDNDIRQLLEDEKVTLWFPGHFGPLEAATVKASWGGLR